jgi:hypothetical protein
MDCGSSTAATREVAKCKLHFIGSTGGQREYEWHWTTFSLEMGIRIMNWEQDFLYIKQSDQQQLEDKVC